MVQIKTCAHSHLQFVIYTVKDIVLLPTMLKDPIHVPIFNIVCTTIPANTMNKINNFNKSIMGYYKTEMDKIIGRGNSLSIKKIVEKWNSVAEVKLNYNKIMKDDEILSTIKKYMKRWQSSVPLRKTTIKYFLPFVLEEAVLWLATKHNIHPRALENLYLEQSHGR